jgi:hypothetical protein
LWDVGNKGLCCRAWDLDLMPMVRRCKQKAKVIKLEIEMLEKRSK